VVRVSIIAANALAITGQPTSQTVNAGGSASFAISAVGASGLNGTAPTYQWNLNGAAVTDGTLPNGSVITGATTAALTITGARGLNAGSYTCKVSDALDGYNTAGSTLAAGSIPVSSTSSAAALTVTGISGTPPTITTQPVSRSVNEGANVVFSVAATGTAPLSYQWMKDGVALANGGQIAGATTASLAITGARVSDAGSYTVVVGNSSDSVTSTAAILTVISAGQPPAPPTATAATALSNTGFTANWAAAASATGYRLDVATDTVFSQLVSGYADLDVGAVLSATVSGLNPGVTYYYRVRAYNSAGTSANSVTIAMTTMGTRLSPTITSAVSTVFTAGVASSFTVTATGTPAPTFTATGLPSWAALNATSGVLSGIAPTAAIGTQISLTITAHNGATPDATQFFTLQVRAVPSASTPLTITTIAGLAGTSGTTDGTGSAARFNLPMGAGTDSAGNVYLADSGNHVIRRVTSAGVVTTLAGNAGIAGTTNGTGTAAHFNAPSGIAVDSVGNVFVADTLNHAIRKVTTAGGVSTVAGLAGTSGSANGVGSVARFFGPQGVAVNAAGTTLYVADTNNDVIRSIDLASSTVTTFAGLSGQAGSADGVGNAARFNAPSAIAVDGNGTVYVADTDNNVIRTITAAGVVDTVAGLAGASGAADGTGPAARFNSPAALAVDSSFNVYVLDTDNHTIRKIESAAGVVTTVAGHAGASGSADGVGDVARFKFPSGLAMDASGNFYIGDTNNHTLRLGFYPGAPVIQTQPRSTTVTVGGAAQFTVIASGQPAPSYQWMFNGAVISGATTSTLSVLNVQPSNAGSYTVVVSNAAGSVTSNEAVLTVNQATPVTGQSGGGGGALSLWFYLALAVMAAARLAALRRSTGRTSPEANDP
jgi:sugar lactone lactonase YvrE